MCANYGGSDDMSNLYPIHSVRIFAAPGFLTGVFGTLHGFGTFVNPETDRNTYEYQRLTQ